MLRILLETSPFYSVHHVHLKLFCSLGNLQPGTPPPHARSLSAAKNLSSAPNLSSPPVLQPPGRRRIAAQLEPLCRRVSDRTSAAAAAGRPVFDFGVHQRFANGFWLYFVGLSLHMILFCGAASSLQSSCGLYASAAACLSEAVDATRMLTSSSSASSSASASAASSLRCLHPHILVSLLLAMSSLAVVTG